MQQNGDFTDEAEGVNLVTELYEREQANAALSRAELQTNITEAEEMVRDDIDEEADRLMLSQVRYTDDGSFYDRLADLIVSHRLRSQQTNWQRQLEPNR